jgi:hypothetical protein
MLHELQRDAVDGRVEAGGSTIANGQEDSEDGPTTMGDHLQFAGVYGEGYACVS